MTNYPDALTGEHKHIADAIGFNVPPAVLTRLEITGAGPFVGRTVRCAVGEHPAYVAIANRDCGGRIVDAPEFEAAIAAAIASHFSQLM